MPQKRRLGRGLESLVGGTTPAVDAGPATRTQSVNDHAIPFPEPNSIDTRVVDIESFVPNPEQPREQVSADTLADLVASIRQNGMLQPVVARRAGKRYEIIAGERRWRAAKAAGLSEIPVLVRQASDSEMLELALVENIQRSDLNPIERARAYQRGCAMFGLSPEEMGRRVGDDRTTVTNYVRLLSLPEPVLRLVGRGELSMGHARCLLALEGDAARITFARRAVKQQLSVRRLEDEVRRATARTSDGPIMSATVSRSDANLRDLERRLAGALGTKVAIRAGRRKGSGRIVVHYRNLDEFDRLTALLGMDGE